MNVIVAAVARGEITLAEASSALEFMEACRRVVRDEAVLGPAKPSLAFRS